jgi:large subunit ribosomal protein L21
MYAIVKTGGKQYRVERGQSLLVERLPEEDGGKVALEPLLVVGHERGPKLRIVKFKPKRGYKRRTGHRQELTRIEITEIKVAARRSRAKAPPKEGGASGAAGGAPAPPASGEAPAPGADAAAGADTTPTEEGNGT